VFRDRDKERERERESIVKVDMLPKPTCVLRKSYSYFIECVKRLPKLIVHDIDLILMY